VAVRIGIIIGSIREGRRGAEVGAWVVQRAEAVTGADFVVLDLMDFSLPLHNAPVLPAMANRNYGSDAVTRWSDAVDQCDGFIFVTPEYNYGVPGAFKNAVDSLGPEWMQKTVAFISYGANGGVRATGQWRQIVANFDMVDVRPSVALSIFDDFNGDSSFTPRERHDNELRVVFERLIALTRLVRGA
jgi:NAD(P)H-dependent FMN reductase